MMHVSYALHLAKRHVLNLFVFLIVAIALSKYGIIDAVLLSMVFLINFYDHIKSHHRFKDFVTEQKSKINEYSAV